jgi:hypothetical protein
MFVFTQGSPAGLKAGQFGALVGPPAPIQVDASAARKLASTAGRISAFVRWLGAKFKIKAGCAVKVRVTIKPDGTKEFTYDANCNGEVGQVASLPWKATMVGIWAAGVNPYIGSSATAAITSVQWTEGGKVLPTFKPLVFSVKAAPTVLFVGRNA